MNFEALQIQERVQNQFDLLTEYYIVVSPSFCLSIENAEFDVFGHALNSVLFPAQSIVIQNELIY